MHYDIATITDALDAKKPDTNNNRAAETNAYETGARPRPGFHVSGDDPAVLSDNKYEMPTPVSKTQSTVRSKLTNNNTSDMNDYEEPKHTNPAFDIDSDRNHAYEEQPDLVTSEGYLNVSASSPSSEDKLTTQSHRMTAAVALAVILGLVGVALSASNQSQSSSASSITPSSLSSVSIVELAEMVANLQGNVTTLAEKNTALQRNMIALADENTALQRNVTALADENAMLKINQNFVLQEIAMLEAANVTNMVMFEMLKNASAASSELVTQMQQKMLAQEENQHRSIAPSAWLNTQGQYGANEIKINFDEETGRVGYGGFDYVGAFPIQARVALNLRTSIFEMKNLEYVAGALYITGTGDGLNLKTFQSLEYIGGNLVISGGTMRTVGGFPKIKVINGFQLIDSQSLEHFGIFEELTTIRSVSDAEGSKSIYFNGAICIGNTGSFRFGIEHFPKLTCVSGELRAGGSSPKCDARSAGMTEELIEKIEGIKRTNCP